MIRECNLHWRYEDTESGLVMPWLTLPTLEWLKSMDISRWRIFEYGCGYSTVWFRLNCYQLVSVDTNQNWAKAVGAEFVPDNNAYVRSCVINAIPIDCIIVDGDWREECLFFAVNELKQNGFLIIDNWMSEDFPPDACERTLELLKYWPYKLFKQPNHSNWVTAVFRKPYGAAEASRKTGYSKAFIQRRLKKLVKSEVGGKWTYQ